MWYSLSVFCDTLWSSEFIYAPDLLQTIIFADENFRDSTYLVAVEMLVCEISRRDDKTSSCNHDMDLVIGDITLVFIDPCWFGEQ